MKISAEQLAKQAARHDVSISILDEMKSIRPSYFLRRKRRLQFAKILSVGIERSLPDVDFIPDLFPSR